MGDALKTLLERAKSARMTSEEREEQRRSFAYGNSKIENDRITRATIDEAAKNLSRKGRSGG